MTPILARLLERVEELEADYRRAHISRDFKWQKAAGGEYLHSARTLLPAMAKALKAAMEPLAGHFPELDLEIWPRPYCSLCGTEWPCTEQRLVLEIESLLAEGLNEVK